MNMSPEEAQAALDDIRRVTTKSQDTLNFWASYTLLWGIVWTIGFLFSQLQPQLINWIWTGMVITGMVGSGILGSIQTRRTRLVPGSRAAFIGSRLSITFGVLYGFAILWLILFNFTTLQTGMFWITFIMLGCIITGVWYQEPRLIMVCVGITIMSLLGYYLLPQYFWLWAAVFAGLPLVGAGIYFLRRR